MLPSWKEKMLTWIGLRWRGKLEGINEDDDEEEEKGKEKRLRVLRIGRKVRARVSTYLQLKMFGDQRRVDFVVGGVWALKFYSDDDYMSFVTRFQDCLFKNVYGLKAKEENKVQVYGKEFIAWVKPEAANDSMWEEADGTWGTIRRLGWG